MSDVEPVVTSERLEVHARHVLAFTQLGFFLLLATCVLMDHSATVENDGISFYGVHATTLPIIAAAFAIGAGGLWRTARYFSAIHAPRLTTAGLRFVAVGLVALLLTPFNHGTVLNWMHMSIGVAMALVQLAISILLLVRRPSTRPALGFALQLIGGVVAALSLPDWHLAYLLQGETIYEVGFSWCLIEWTYLVHSRPLTRR